MPELMVYMADPDKTGEVHIDAQKNLPVATTSAGNIFQVPMRHRALLQARGFIEVASPWISYSGWR